MTGSIGKQRKRNIKRACKIESTEKRFTNLSFGTVWEENSLPTKQRRHPHQKPKELIKALIGATTNEGDLVVDPCAGSFIVLEVCQELKREYLGHDLTFEEVKNFLGNNQQQL